MEKSSIIELERLFKLLRGLQEKNFWGTAQVTFKDGKPIMVTVSQTINHSVSIEQEPQILVIVAQQPK